MSHRNGQYSILSGFLHLPLFSSQAKQQVTPNLRPQLSEQVPEGSNLQNGNSVAVAANRRVDLLSRFQRCLLLHSHMPQLLKIPKVSLLKSDFSVHNCTFSLSTAPMEFTIVVKEIKLMAQSRHIRIHQYLDDWLIQAEDKKTYHQHTWSLLAISQDLGWIVNLQKSDLIPQ